MKHMDLKEQYDIVVIGGGPSGATAARLAAEKGASVLLVERDKINKKSSMRCTGLISVRAFTEAGVSLDCIIREINGAFVYAPDGRRLNIDGQVTKAFVIDRNKFDQALLNKAIDVGVRVITGAKVVSLEAEANSKINKVTTPTSKECGLLVTGYPSSVVPEPTYLSINTGRCQVVPIHPSKEGGLSGRVSVKLQKEGQQKTVAAKVIIGADGPYSKVARWVGLPPPQKLLPAIQAFIPYKPEREDFVEVFLGREIAPNFFAWAVPASKGLARVGLAADTDADKPGSLKLLLNRLLDIRFSKSKEIIELGWGAIPIGPAPSTVRDHVLLVGSAAGQAKPTSGGGIYTGILCAKLAGEVAAKCALNDTSAEALLEYERRWRNLLERELLFGMQAHKILCQMSDADLNKIFALLDSPKILRVFAQYGDIDYPSKLAKEFIKIPQLWGRLLHIIPAKDLLTGILRLLV